MLHAWFVSDKGKAACLIIFALFPYWNLSLDGGEWNMALGGGRRSDIYT